MNSNKEGSDGQPYMRRVQLLFSLPPAVLNLHFLGGHAEELALEQAVADCRAYDYDYDYDVYDVHSKMTRMHNLCQWMLNTLEISYIGNAVNESLMRALHGALDHYLWSDGSDAVPQLQRGLRKSRARNSM